MAQLTARGKKTFRVQFRTHRVHSLTLKTTRAEAEIVRGFLSRLEHLRKTGVPPTGQVLSWLQSVSPELKREIVCSGLVNLGSAGGTLRDLLDHAESVYKNLSPHTVRNHKQYHRSLLNYFGADRTLVSITPGDADMYVRSLSPHYGPASVAKRVKHSRQIFNLALRQEWLTRNPFFGIRVSVPVDQDRRRYITPEETELVMQQLRTPEDKLVFALARWAGFRVGSEVRLLTWDDIDFDNLTMRVWSSKTKSYRVCPVFVELQKCLFDVRQQASGNIVCPEFERNTDQFYRKKLVRAIKRAGLEPWPDLLLNCRRSRATEVVERFGAKAESDWIGHGPDISKRHYQMTLQQKIDEAVGRNLKLK